VAAPGAAAHPLAEVAHAGEHAIDVRHDVPAPDQDRTVGAVAQSDVQHRPIFGRVDPVACEHPRAPGLEPGFAGQIQQQAHGFLGDPVLGVIEQQVTLAQREARESVGIAGEQVAQMHRGHGVGMARERPPRGRPGESGHGAFPNRTRDPAPWRRGRAR
jgi:hypothetical protein